MEFKQNESQENIDFDTKLMAFKSGEKVQINADFIRRLVDLGNVDLVKQALNRRENVTYHPDLYKCAFTIAERMPALLKDLIRNPEYTRKPTLSDSFILGAHKELIPIYTLLDAHISDIPVNSDIENGWVSVLEDPDCDEKIDNHTRFNIKYQLFRYGLSKLFDVFTQKYPLPDKEKYQFPYDEVIFGFMFEMLINPRQTPENVQYFIDYFDISSLDGIVPIPRSRSILEANSISPHLQDFIRNEENVHRIVYEKQPFTSEMNEYIEFLKNEFAPLMQKNASIQHQFIEDMFYQLFKPCTQSTSTSSCFFDETQFFGANN